MKGIPTGTAASAHGPACCGQETAAQRVLGPCRLSQPVLWPGGWRLPCAPGSAHLRLRHRASATHPSTNAPEASIASTEGSGTAFTKSDQLSYR